MEEVLSIAICEDAKPDEEKLLAILAQCSIPNRCTVFSSGEDLLAQYQVGLYDLLLTDIYMGGMSGVETVTRIREIDPDIPVAFVTSSIEHTLESYRLSALKYIEKPYRVKEIEDILKLALMGKNSAPGLIVYKNGKPEKIRFSKILFVEQQTHQLGIHLQSGETVQIYEKLSVLLPQLEEADFFMPHKSFSVNLSFVQWIDPELRCFVMSSGENVPIRRESLGKAKKALETYLFNRTRGLSS